MQYAIGYVRENDTDYIRLIALDSNGNHTDEIIQEESFDIKGILAPSDKGEVVLIDDIDDHKSGSGKGDDNGKKKNK